MIGFYIFLLFEKFLMLLPRSVRRGFFLSLAWLAYHISKRYTKVVRQNLRFVYGDNIDETFIQEVTKGSYTTLLLNFLHTIEGHYYAIEDIAKNVDFENIEVVQNAIAQNRPIIFITAHYGAWELGAQMLSARIVPLTVVYKSMKNNYFNDYILSARSKWRIDYVEKHGAAKSMIKRLKEKKAVAFLMDINVNEKDGLQVDFLGHPTLQTKVTAYLARKFDAALMPILIHSDDNQHYVIKAYDELIPPKTEDEKSDILASTQMQASWLTDEILKNPKPWFWLHRRWKNDYPEIYKK
jgi:Kdo2-lipid IVA lauroyltransferase/acyltransferase